MLGTVVGGFYFPFFFFFSGWIHFMSLRVAVRHTDRYETAEKGDSVLALMEDLGSDTDTKGPEEQNTFFLLV